MIKINGVQVDQKKFPDGTPLININKNNISDTQGVLSIILWEYENMEELFVLYSLVKQIKATFSYSDICLDIPYVPNARQDRVKNCNDVFTLKWFCDIINDLGFITVTIVDPHSDVTPALLNNCRVLTNEVFFNNVKEKVDFDIVFYPDNGAKSKYEKFIKYPSAFGIKNRDWQTGKILSLDVFGNVKNKNILIVDDICSKGGTFLHSAKKLKELGAKNIYLMITHCENSILGGELIDSGLITKIFTTRSIFTKQHKLIDVIETFNF